MATEKRLIDANALRERHCEGCNEDIREMCRVDPICASLQWVDEEPTVDAVEVVRCKDCKHRADALDCGNYLCNRKMIGMVRPNDFCSFGERRSE